MNTHNILHRRNKLLVYILWFSMVLGVVVTMRTNAAQTPILITVGGLIALIATVLVWKRWLTQYMMYYIVIALAIISYILIAIAVSFTTYLIIYYSLAICTLYNNYRPTVLSSVFALFFTNYFFITERETLFAGFEDFSIFSLNLFVVLITGPLIATGVFSERLQKQVLIRNEEVEAAQRRSNELLEHIVESAKQLEQISSGLNESIGSVGVISSEMTASFADVSKSTESANVSLSGISESVNTLNEEINLVSGEAVRLSELSNRNTVLTDEGTKQATQLGEEMEKINAIIEKTVALIRDLNERNEQIGEIITVISEISSQTHLLALNAAIEAARVGEHGKGFEVVSIEIRKLSEMTQHSTEHIADILHAIQEHTKLITDEVFLGQQSIAIGNQLSAEMLNSQHEIADNTLLVADSSKEMAGSVARLNDVSSQISLEMASLSAMTEQNMAAVEEITASIEQQDSNIADIVNRYHNVNELTKRLNEETAK